MINELNEIVFKTFLLSGIKLDQVLEPVGTSFSPPQVCPIYPTDFELSCGFW